VSQISPKEFWLFGALVYPFLVIYIPGDRKSQPLKELARSPRKPRNTREEPRRSIIVSKTQKMLLRSTFSNHDLRTLECRDVPLAGHGFKGS